MSDELAGPVTVDAMRLIMVGFVTSREFASGPRDGAPLSPFAAGEGAVLESALVLGDSPRSLECSPTSGPALSGSAASWDAQPTAATNAKAKQSVLMLPSGSMGDAIAEPRRHAHLAERVSR